MEMARKIAVLRELAAYCRQVEEILGNGELLEGIAVPTEEEYRRHTLLLDSVQRLRRQAGHMVAALVLGPENDRLEQLRAAEAHPRRRVEGKTASG